MYMLQCAFMLLHGVVQDVSTELLFLFYINTVAFYDCFIALSIV